MIVLTNLARACTAELATQAQGADTILGAVNPAKNFSMAGPTLSSPVHTLAWP